MICIDSLHFVLNCVVIMNVKIRGIVVVEGCIQKYTPDSFWIFKKLFIPSVFQIKLAYTKTSVYPFVFFMTGIGYNAVDYLFLDFLSLL